jgi:hypothetical protein
MEKLKTILDLVVKYPFFIVGAILVVIGAVGVVPLGTSSGSSSLPIASQWRILLAAIGVLAIAFDAARSWREPSVQSLAKATGGIAQPTANSAVMREIAATGWSRDIESTMRLWLIVEVGNQKWPKGNELQVAADGTWQSAVYEDGTGTMFSLSLYVADKDGHAKIRAWLDIGALIGYHPFEVDIPGTRRLARIDGLHK